MLQFFSPFSGMTCRDICHTWRLCDWHLSAPTWLGAISRYFQMCVSFSCLFSSLFSYIQCYYWILEKSECLKSQKKKKKEPHKTNKTKVITCLSNHFVPHFYAREKELVMSILYPSYSFKKYFGLGWISQLFEASSHIPKDCGLDPLLCPYGR